jgi:methanogenic corrinoid protein MtbC1
LEHVGSCWALDEINVAQEHYATAVTQEIITSLGPQVRLPPVDGRLAVVTASPDELHVLGPQILALMLEGEGWEVLWLGAATPALDLAELVAAERPDVVALSTSTAGRVGGVVDALRALDRLRPRPLLAMGGGLYTQQAADYARAQGADVVTSDVREFLSQLRRRFPPV